MTHSQRARSAFNHANDSVQLLLAAFAIIGFGQPAISQQSSGTLSNVEMVPRGHREVTDVTYSDWKKLCFRPGGAKLVCRTSITGTFATGQMALRLDIIEHESHDAARLQVFAPVGMYLPNPVRVMVDQGGAYRAPYTWCLTNTCIAGTVADPKLLKEMTAGQMLRLEFLDSNLLSLTASLPLDRFMAVHEGPPAQIFEQDIDE
ncbi:invasion associated locus B family protein [Afipia sp. TerB]